MNQQIDVILKLVKAQFVILLLGTVFAWTNFGIELVSWLGKRANPYSCAAGQIVNPFFTPCFYGAIFFTIAFVLSALMLNESRTKE